MNICTKCVVTDADLLVLHDIVYFIITEHMYRGQDGRDGYGARLRNTLTFIPGGAIRVGSSPTLVTTNLIFFSVIKFLCPERGPNDARYLSQIHLPSCLQLRSLVVPD